MSTDSLVRYTMRSGVGLLLGILLMSTVYALEDFDRQQIEQRIKPVGQVRMEGAPKTNNRLVAKPSSEKKIRTAQAIFEQYCSLCHRDGLAGAPKFQAASDWQPRLDKQTLDELVATAIQGMNAMPPKGTCVDCTKEEIKSAIQYMLPKS